METLYIIDPTKKFNGVVENTMRSTGYVDYMDKPTTFEEYKKLKGNDNLIALEYQELNEKYWKPYYKSLTESVEEITEEKFYDLFECLPPAGLGNIAGAFYFFVGEPYTADLHTLCIAKDGMYYSGLLSVNSTKEEIKNHIISHIN